MTSAPVHGFHVPVMGTGFTLDTPLRVARFGISSVVSLVDDRLLHRVHEVHAHRAYVPFIRIGGDHAEARARRITGYLNFLEEQVSLQVEHIRRCDFEPGSPLTRYFELLPPGSLRRSYERMAREAPGRQRRQLEDELRSRVVRGAIDVNIMTKVDRDLEEDGSPRASEDSDALSALTGFVDSTLTGGVVLSAGFNPRLVAHAAKTGAFDPDEEGRFSKTIIVKVSDFRSAEIQARYFAKKGLWISEFRVESGLNCGGHAFVSEGAMLGPVLQEFADRRDELVSTMFQGWSQAIRAKGLTMPLDRPPVRLTVQGGIGTAAEHRLMRKLYRVDGSGWGTPFLLVPEVTAVDDETRKLLADASIGDVELSALSPLGVPFWTLVNSASERARKDRISRGRPGSTCPKGFLARKSELSPVPLCPASRGYQRRALALVDSHPGRESDRDAITAKACICHDLGGGISRELGLDPTATPAICPGPNIAYFHRIVGLEEMVGHIYGRNDILQGVDRPHMFLAELRLHIQWTERNVEVHRPPSAKAVAAMRRSMAYYRDLAGRGALEEHTKSFQAELEELSDRLETVLGSQARSVASLAT